METYQAEIIDMFKDFRPPPEYPTYPPYHVGPYLEEYFFYYFANLKEAVDRYYIPIYWTNCYLNNKTNGLQESINRLDPNKKYFTISQHDDGIKESLPIDTLCFNAGGNGGGIPIPLICSPLPAYQTKPKDIFCSFVGSITHPIREKINRTLIDSKYLIHSHPWSPKIRDESLRFFIEITSRSVFCLCPRGYGRTSFRLYEAMQLGSVPVYVYDAKWCPFEEEIDWPTFCILIHENNISDIDSILSRVSPSKINEMQQNLRPIWRDNFTMKSTSQKIIKYMEKLII